MRVFVSNIRFPDPLLTVHIQTHTQHTHTYTHKQHKKKLRSIIILLRARKEQHKEMRELSCLPVGRLRWPGIHEAAACICGIDSAAVAVSLRRAFASAAKRAFDSHKSLPVFTAAPSQSASLALAALLLMKRAVAPLLRCCAIRSSFVKPKCRRQ